MIRKTVLLFDVHLDNSIYKNYKLAKKFVKEYRPHEIILGGDFANCASISHWNLKNKKLMENKRWAETTSFLKSELISLKKLCKKVTWLEGNHEAWVHKYVDNHPEIEGFVELPLACDLEKIGVKWVEMNKLYPVCEKLVATHGMYVNKYHTSKHLDRINKSIIYGHNHDHQVFMSRREYGDAYRAYAIGCLFDEPPAYLKNMPTNWITQFAIVEHCTNTEEFQVTPIDINNNKIIWNGKTIK